MWLKKNQAAKITKIMEQLILIWLLRKPRGVGCELRVKRAASYKLQAASICTSDLANC
jgi:hypothetical protein